jgi:integrase
VEADGKRAAFMAARADGFTAPRGRPYYVGEWVLRWLENTARPRISEATYSRTYLHHVRDLIAPYFERVPLPELTVEDIEAWHAQLARRPARRGGGMVSAATIGQAHTILSMALNTAVARRKLPHNPCALVHPPRSRPARPEPPTADEVVRIIERCQTWPYGARWIVAITTGIRQGEALRLRWRHVHLDGNEPYIDVPGTKSEAAVRAAPLPPVAVDALREWRRTQVRDLTDGRVFTLPQRADWQNWRDLTGDLGLPHYRVHDLRHAFATALLEEGEDIKVVQVLIGHASPDFTRRVYQHVRPVLHRRAADAMQRYVTGQ